MRLKAKTSLSSDWIAYSSFDVDVPALMNELITKLRSKCLFVHKMHDLVKAIMSKLQFLSNQLENKIFIHMQTLKEVKLSATHVCRFSSMIGACAVSFQDDLKI